MRQCANATRERAIDILDTLAKALDPDPNDNSQGGGGGGPGGGGGQVIIIRN